MIAVSYLSVKKDLKTFFSTIENTDADFIHYDVLDGVFAQNTSPSYGELEKYSTTKKKDIHLMVNDVASYVEKYRKLNPHYLTFHIEVGNTLSYLSLIKKHQIKVGLAINPTTDIKALEPFLDKIDLVLLMSVEPGYGGQEFLKETKNRLEELLILRKNHNFKIAVDGGINVFNAIDLAESDILVSGNYITSGSYQDRIDDLRKLQKV